MITVYTRFLNLNWDQGYGLHPDENNLWGASREVKLFSQLDPHFYAYGGFPIYLYSLFDNRSQARAVSAVAQAIIILLFFYLGRKLAGWPGAFFSGFIGTFSAGLVQASHFLTVESLIGLCSLLVIVGLLNLKKRWGILVAALALGIGIGTKVSFIVFLLPFFFVRPFRKFLAAIVIAGSVFVLTNPYIFWKQQDILGSLRYEANVATGKIPVFYTREFIETIPGWFQIIHIFPFVAGWGFVPLVILGLFAVFVKDGPSRTGRTVLLIASISVILSFFPFWAKWTRYVVQILPVLILIAGVGASYIWKKGVLGKLGILVTFATFFPLFFSMIQVYRHQDTRLAAADWAVSHIDNSAKIFSEGMDLGIIPFNPAHGTQITLFNFYELDEDRTGRKQKELQQLIEQSDYFISVSQRVYKNSMDGRRVYPPSGAFYASLFNGRVGYHLVKEFSVDYQPNAEETFSVFDHPRVLIFKKQ